MNGRRGYLGLGLASVAEVGERNTATVLEWRCSGRPLFLISPPSRLLHRSARTRNPGPKNSTWNLSNYLFELKLTPEKSQRLWHRLDCLHPSFYCLYHVSETASVGGRTLHMHLK